MVGNIEKVGGYAPVLCQIVMLCFETFVVKAVVELSYVRESLA